MDKTITVTLPGPLFEALQARAARAHRGIDEEIVEALEEAIPADEQLPAVLQLELADLANRDDAALWQAARRLFPGASAGELEALHFKRQQASLTAEETRRAAELLDAYDQYVLLRSEAAALLKQRGYDISVLLKPR